MSYIEITGGSPLEGEVLVQGAKNSALPLLAACLLAPGVSTLHNCPDLSDVEAALDILRLLGCGITREGDAVSVSAVQPESVPIPERLTRELRSSILFSGAMLARLREADLAYPGGCDLGPRPIDLHIMALRALGAHIREEGGYLLCRSGVMLGREIRLSFPSVGATENAMLAATACPGYTSIVGAAREPEIVELQKFLYAMGADIRGAGEGTVVIRGGQALCPAVYPVMGDRIAAATYLAAAAAAGGEILVRGVRSEHLSSVLAVLEEAGCRIDTTWNTVTLRSDGRLRAVSPIRTAPYPGFPTDAQPLLMAALAGAEGTTMFVETMFPSRYRHVDELTRMGADIRTDGRVAVVNGVGRLRGAGVRGTDLRGTAALVIAALGAEGTTRIRNVSYIDRGYSGLCRNLASLGAEIRRVP